MEKYIEQNGITYELRGEQYYPLLELPEQKEIGRWGLLHLGYLKRFAIARYNELLMSGELNTYLYARTIRVFDCRFCGIPRFDRRTESNGSNEMGTTRQLRCKFGKRNR